MSVDLQTYIVDNSTPVPFSGCWLWDRTVNLKTYCVVGNTKAMKAEYAHRISYRAFKGEIANGQEVHHSCQIKGCVNPAHLHILDHTEHRRFHSTLHKPKEFCIRGHALTGDNVQWVHGGKHRQCRICNRRSDRRDPLWQELKELARLEKMFR